MKGDRERGDEGGADDRGEAMPTLEVLWQEHGVRLRRSALRLLDDDLEAADAACFAVMVRVAEWLELSRGPVERADELRWLARLCVEVCDTIRAEGVDPSWLAAGPLPGSLPERVRASLQFRAARDALDRADESAGVEGPVARARRRDRQRWRARWERFRGAPVVVLLPRVLRRAWEGAEQAGRDAWRRVEGAAATMLPSGQRVGGLLTAGSGLPEAAAALSAAVALGIAGPASAAPAEAPDLLAAPEHVAASHEPLRLTATAFESRAAGEDDRPTVVDVATPAEPEDPEEEPASEPARTTVSAPVGPVEATAEADPGGTANDPVQETPTEHGRKYYVTAGVDASADADGDGEDDVVVGSSKTAWGCAPPGERGPASIVVCPVLEDSGMPSEEESGG